MTNILGIKKSRLNAADKAVPSVDSVMLNLETAGVVDNPRSALKRLQKRLHTVENSFSPSTFKMERAEEDSWMLTANHDPLHFAAILGFDEFDIFKNRATPSECAQTFDTVLKACRLAAQAQDQLTGFFDDVTSLRASIECGLTLREEGANRVALRRLMEGRHQLKKGSGLSQLTGTTEWDPSFKLFGFEVGPSARTDLTVSFQVVQPLNKGKSFAWNVWWTVEAPTNDNNRLLKFKQSVRTPGTFFPSTEQSRWLLGPEAQDFVWGTLMFDRFLGTFIPNWVGDLL